ncbi:MAG: hypothetical protein RLZZ502_1366 [Pseudomonadota bacterium]
MRMSIKIFLLLAALAGCASSVVYRNNHSAETAGSLSRFLSWQWERLGIDSPLKNVPPNAQGLPFPLLTPALEPAQASTFDATWIGHATVLLRVGQVNVLTDPILSARASPITFAGPKRFMPPAMTKETLPHIDVVVISHNHYDHLDLATVKDLSAQPGGSPLFLVGMGLAQWFQAQGISHVRELNWWQSHEHQGKRYTFTPVQHWSKRTLFDAHETLWGAWVVEDLSQSKRFYFAGDTGYSADFAETGRRFAGGFDLAAIPIGAYAPRWFMQPQHVDPAEALRIAQDLGARRAIAIHWGTFVLTDEPVEEPPKLLAQALAAARLASDYFRVLTHGETWR